MIDSNIIDWIDFGDTIQNIDVYLNKKALILFKCNRFLNKNKKIPLLIYLVFLSIFYIQIWTISLINVSNEKEFLLGILNNLKNVTILFELITNALIYKKIFLIIFLISILYITLIIISFSANKVINVAEIIFCINFLNIIIFYYLIGPITEISLSSLWCENGIHKFLKVSCYTNSAHLFFFLISFIFLILFFIITFNYSLYFFEIDLITKKSEENIARNNCNYELYCLVSKILIFIFGFLFYKLDYEEDEHFIFKIIYEASIFIICLIMSIYIYKNVYYYNNIIHNMNTFGWYFSTWFTFCIICKSLLNLNVVSVFIFNGWIIIIILFDKQNNIKENELISNSNIFELTNVKSIEMFKNILLNNLINKQNNKSKILLLGVIKKFEEYSYNNPEINNIYHKLLNDKYLNKKFNKQIDLPILSIIYLLYSFYMEKLHEKEEIIFHMCYYMINKFNNPTYAMLLCSKIRSKNHKSHYYKYILTEEIKSYLIYKLNKNSHKKTIKHIEIGKVILYYSYINLFRVSIYDGLSNQINYFDLLKNTNTTNKTTKNFLKSGVKIFRIINDILCIWKKIIELNPSNDESYNDLMMYLKDVIQDELLIKEEEKKYKILKKEKYKNKNDVYNNIFIADTSAILLIDGYSINGKIIYASPNFSSIFMYSSKEILSMVLDDLLPNYIQTFHKELINDAVKYSNIKYIFKNQVDSLLKNKNGVLINIKLFVKPVPNLSYGLIYYSYLQKCETSNYIIILDKDFKIVGFTENQVTDYPFIINNIFNLNNNIIGCHIGTIIPDILCLLEYKNEEYQFSRLDYEIKGYLYPVEKTKNIKLIIDKILLKIKNDKNGGGDLTDIIEDGPENISVEFNELMEELTIQNIKPYCVFYTLKLYSFIQGKYKYYRVYISIDILSRKEFGFSFSGIDKAQIHSNNNILIPKKPQLINYGEQIETSKPNKIFNIKNKSENSLVTINSNKNIKIDINKENSNKKNNLEKKTNVEKSNSQLNNKSNISIGKINKIKYYIIKKKEIFPLKLMKILKYIFLLISVGIMVIEFIFFKKSFNNLTSFLRQNLFFNSTKIYIGVLYSVAINIRWMSHSLFENSLSHLNQNWATFYQNILNTNVQSLQLLKDNIIYLEENFKNIIYRNYSIDIYFYKFEQPEKLELDLENILAYVINNEIKLMDKFSYFDRKGCQIISKELSLDEVNLKNLIEMSYFYYNSSINGFKGKDKEKKIDKIFSLFPYNLLIYGLFLLCILIFYFYFIISLNNIEIYFLEKLINFNSNNFDNYIKSLLEKKNKYGADNSDESEKGDLLNVNINENESKKKDKNDENDFFGEKEPPKHINIVKNKKEKNKKSTIIKQKSKKFKLMKLYFNKYNFLLQIKIISIVLLSLIYYIVVFFMKTKFKNDYLNFDKANNSLEDIFKISYDIYIKLKREINFYENNLINCNTTGEFKPINLPKINEIITPKIGNILMEITENNKFKKESISQFNSLFYENVCELLMEFSNQINYCLKFWSGVLSKGMNQGIIQMDVVLGNVLDELFSLNNWNNSIKLIDLMKKSYFIDYEQFIIYYMFKAYNSSCYILEELRNEKINSIISSFKLFLFSYIILVVILFGAIVYFIYSFNYIFSTSLYFIGIIPLKYICEDEKFYNSIIDFGNKYF